MIGRLAVELAFSREPEHRWRQVATPVAVVVAVTLVMIGASVIALFQREVARKDVRAPTVAMSASPSDLLLSETPAEWNGESFSVMWIEPAGDAASVIPPGLDALPEPGQAAVSPALDRAIRSDPDLAGRFPNRIVIGNAGTQSGDELFAYVRVPEGRTLGETALRVSGFGRSVEPLDQEMVAGATVQVDHTVRDGALGAMASAWLPALIILWVGVTAGSSARDRRVDLLARLGASRRQIRLLVAIETLVLVAPAALAASIAAAVALASMTRIPIVDRFVLPGDLGLPVAVVVAVVGIVTVLTLDIAWLTTDGRPQSPPPTRARTSAVGFAGLRLLPVAVSAAAVMTGFVLGGETGSFLKVLGLIATVVAVPVLMPILVRIAGELVAEGRSLVSLLAGRAMSREAGRVTRPFATLASVVVIALLATAYMALASRIERSPTAQIDGTVVGLSWLDQQAGDLESIRRALPGIDLVPVRQAEMSGTVTIEASCPALASLGLLRDCAEGDSWRLTPEDRQQLAFLVRMPPDSIRLSPPAAPGERVSLLVFDRTGRDAHATMADVGEVAVRLLGPSSVVVLDVRVLRSSPLVDWLRGAVAVALVGLFTAGLVASVDRIIATRRRRRVLGWIGAAPRFLRRLEGWLFVLPYSVVALGSFMAGLAICVLVAASTDIGMPWRGIGGTAVLVTITGAIGAVAVMTLGVRHPTATSERNT